MNSVSVGTLDSRDLCELWHRRMAHLHHGALRILREIAIGVPEFSIEHDEVCGGCAMGKYVKAPFPSRDNRATGSLELIHTRCEWQILSPILGWLRVLYYIYR